MEGLYLVFVIIALFFVIVFYYFQEKNGKKKIKTHLEHQGFQQVKIQKRLSGVGKGTLVLDIEYFDQNGIAQKNSCTIHTVLFSDGKMYWEKPLD